jgi:predicted ribosome quality control (RQC) complex YloA/Tae2 family protein
MGVSNRISYDPILVRYLADELAGRIGGRRCAAIPYFTADRAVVLPLDRGEQLRMDLHPSRGWFRIQPGERLGEDELDGTIRGVEPVRDERILRIPIEEAERFRAQTRTLVVELPTNQWNAMVLDEADRIVSLLHARRSGARSLHAGERYQAPRAENRFGSGEVDRLLGMQHWTATLAGVAAETRTAVLIREFSDTGTMNARWILDADTLNGAFDRWWWLRSHPPESACILALPDGPLPYPFPLEGITAEPAGSLLAAMDVVAATAVEPSEDPALAAARALVERVLTGLDRRVARLREEERNSTDAERLRTLGDVLLARLREVPRGESQVTLEGWEGEPILIPLDPTLTPAENANRYYDRARKKQKAAEQIPGMIAVAEEERARWELARAGLAGGAVPDWLAARMRQELVRPEIRGAAGAESPRPYRVFRTSGGLEVRVGRGSRENDRLTFSESSPEDVWLHARSVPGSHVILRWRDTSGSPPARDLEEAAQLAALFSRARTSSTVAVDWTRRKYVRKPRGAAPGLVIPQRVRTLFVEPDPEVAERLAVEALPAG